MMDQNKRGVGISWKIRKKQRQVRCNEKHSISMERKTFQFCNHIRLNIFDLEIEDIALYSSIKNVI